MINSILIDDEVPHIATLAGLLNKNFSDINILASCNSVEDGYEKVSALKPDLIFLDVLMPPKTGFDLLEKFKPIPFEVIFTTSHDAYAIQAFKVSAVDYLLKPFDKDDLANALLKFEQRFAVKQSLRHFETLLHNIHNNTSEKAKIALPTMSGFIFVQVNDIVRCESDNVYTTFFMTDKSQHVVSKTMKECEELLNHYNFFRIHQSHLINMRHIKEYLKGDGGMVKMDDGSAIDVSRRKKDDFLKVLNKI